MKVTLNDIAIVGVFSALAFAGAYLLLPLHNIEIFTTIIFVSGYLFGEKVGTLVGVIASALFAILNPFGISPLPLLLVQMASRGFVGYVGGRFGKMNLAERGRPYRLFAFGLAGLVLTWIYIILALLSGIFTSGFSIEQLKVSFVFGIVSYSILSVGNILIFALVLPFVTDALKRNPYLRQLGASNI